jgi:hypothetical protein
METEDTSMETMSEVFDLIVQSQALLSQAKNALDGAMLEHYLKTPYMDAKTAIRVEKLGEVTHRHLKFIEENGAMTRADSLAIRREMFGGRVQSTANLFGTEGSGAMLWRDRPYGSPVKDDDPVRLTNEGVRITNLWRGAHSD